MVHHIGRRTGDAHRTPVNVFELEGDLVVALTYGPGADWVQNVLAGPATLVRTGTTLRVVATTIVGRDIAWPALPWFVRPALRVLRVRDFLRVQVEAWPSLAE